MKPVPTRRKSIEVYMGWRTYLYGPRVTSSWSGFRPASIRHWRPRDRAPVHERIPASRRKETESAVRQDGSGLAQKLFGHKIEYATPTNKTPPTSAAIHFLRLLMVSSGQQEWRQPDEPSGCEDCVRVAWHMVILRTFQMEDNAVAEFRTREHPTSIACPISRRR
jgi:hypothetical protein